MTNASSAARRLAVYVTNALFGAGYGGSRYGCAGLRTVENSLPARQRDGSTLRDYPLPEHISTLDLPG